MQRAQTKYGQKGFTLLEVMVAASVFAIAMLGILPLLISSYRVDVQTVHRVRAQTMLTQRIDELISQETLTCNGTLNTDFIDAHTGVVSSASPTAPIVIRRTWQVNPPGVGSNLCPITVTVQFTERDGTKTYTTTAQKGL